MLESMLRAINLGVLLVDADCRVIFWNDFMAVNSGKSEAQMLGRSLFDCCPELPQAWVRQRVNSVLLLKNLAFTSWQQRPHLFHFGGTRPITGADDLMYQSCTFFPVLDEQGVARCVGMTVSDTTDTAARQRELERLNVLLGEEKLAQQQLIKRLEDTQAQLLQSEKMAAIGQLAAGVAHEINNPVGFVYSNLNSLRGYLADLFKLIDRYEMEVNTLVDPVLHNSMEAVRADLDYEFLRMDAANLLSESCDGLERVKRIVQDLRDFSHIDSTEWLIADLHEGLDSTLNVIWNEIKFKAKVNKQYGDIEPVECIGSQINQVFMNLLINAAQAIEAHGNIWLSTGRERNGVFIEVRDDGPGIPTDIQRRIFEPFFTTKPVGKGTGLGLSVSYSIVDKHHGSLTVTSEPGQGACFRIWLPLRQS